LRKFSLLIVAYLVFDSSPIYSQDLSYRENIENRISEISDSLYNVIGMKYGPFTGFAFDEPYRCTTSEEIGYISELLNPMKSQSLDAGTQIEIIGISIP